MRYKSMRYAGRSLERRQNGQALLGVVVLFTMIVTTVVVGLVGPLTRHIQQANDALVSMQSYLVAESLAEDLAYRLRTGKQTATLEALSLEGANATANITSNLGAQTIISTGNKYELLRTVQIVLTQGTGLAFNYGTQSGNGGFIISNNAGVNGNVYSNGSIRGSDGSGSNASFIIGTAIAASSISTTTDQANDSPSTPSDAIMFANANGTQDVGQSFKISTDAPANSVSFFIKKNGAPSNATVRITTDDGNKPNDDSLVTAPLNATQVTSNYGWVTAVFPTGASLIAGTTYWVVIDASSNSNNYYILGANISYANGEARIGQYNGSWNATSPAGLDGYFRFYIGGQTSSITDVVVGQNGVGDAWAHTVSGSTIEGNNYCQNGAGNNKACDTSWADPAPQPYPVSDGNIAEWKAAAAAGEFIAGNKTITASSTLGPAEITGNLSIRAQLTLTGVVYVHGTISTNNNNTIKIDPSFGENGTILLADDRIDLGNGAQFFGSGTPGSYILLLTTSNCTVAICGIGNAAINLSNNVGTVIINAQNGEVYVKNGAGASEITADLIDLEPNAIVTYESGLASTVFTTGPSGGYTIASWRETE